MPGAGPAWHQRRQSGVLPEFAGDKDHIGSAWKLGGDNRAVDGREPCLPYAERHDDLGIGG